MAQQMASQDPNKSREHAADLERDASVEVALAKAEEEDAAADLELAKADAGIGKRDEERDLKEKATSLYSDAAEHKRTAAKERREEGRILNGQ